MLRKFLIAGILLAVRANMFDAIDKDRAHPTICKDGCALWSDLAGDGNTRNQSEVNAKWTTGKAPDGADRNCASPGLDPGADGLWCYCKGIGNGTYGYCEPTLGLPEQVNLQLAGPDSVVVSFVTFEEKAPTEKPFVILENIVKITGETHAHQAPSKDRTIFMHFVKLTGLEPRKSYPYQASSGGEGARMSKVFVFRAPYSSGVTKVDVFGDMGVYAWNNMGNLIKDCQEGVADAIIHVGDHAYNEGGDDEKRGDGYMNMYQSVLSQCPWVPVVGNHEAYDGENIKRYQDSTWQNWNDTSSLHALLMGGTMHANSQGSVPSGSARWFSVDLGLIHWVSLDLNIYFGVESSAQYLKTAQADWLKKDLAEANKNRKNVPWILAGAHFPFYCSECSTQAMTADWYSNGFTIDSNGVEREHPPMNTTQLKEMAAAKKQCAAAGKNKACKMAEDVGTATSVAIKDLMPIIHQAGVDMFISGHWHFYESLWPMGVPTQGNGGPPTMKSFDNPMSTVHITTGNGGPPGKDVFPTPMTALRKQSQKFGYGRVTAYNASHLQFEQVLNGWGTEGKAGEIFDSFVLVQNSHGPFPQTADEVVV